ncbi:hypothetical protein MG5_01477 [Candida albicans P57072]|uniref:Uncharacterized protein n=1 Tax=Candida albicans P78048 TaxID=1094989 RepID=A0AB34PXN3_CANAX|nr:hypothetical protein MEU_01472 [Candida albicans P37005]KGR01303.1 hypothetical protein MG1_01487 [Candida albicans GC75]KGR13151.1 hypothetical protein MG5_01477 [Candida albicans P57072]KGR15935.1 hypothetical protein MG3_01527 [Candida albicans P78048]KGR22130.1 hypothetical protein MG9_01481 [Candida albicans P37037]KGT71072.1 hypothetical protein MEK_01506 [Candida albicans 12C]KGU12222.1 hypothetical protein MEQ_01463 [Candida albicans P87]KGU15947.1 hypothetical protein MEY_01480 [
MPILAKCEKKTSIQKKKHKKQIHYLHLTINTFIILYRHEKACEKQT